MSSWSRRYSCPDHDFFELPFPEGPSPIAPPPDDADGNAHTMYNWARAHALHQQLSDMFSELPDGVLWGVDVLERERFIGEWPDGDYESYAYVSLGVLLPKGAAAARAFAETVRIRASKTWDNPQPNEHGSTNGS